MSSGEPYSVGKGAYGDFDEAFLVRGQAYELKGGIKADTQEGDEVFEICGQQGIIELGSYGRNYNLKGLGWC